MRPLSIRATVVLTPQLAFVRLPELEGAAVGDVFAGEAATIPTRDH